MPQRQTPVVVVNNPPALVPEIAEVPKAKTHVVKSGEILPVIAKHYYGPDEGNRRIVIQKLYEANSDILKSPDQVHVGHKLTIPSLDELLNASGGVVKAPNPSEGLLKNFPAIFKRVDKKDTGSVSEYVVQEGESLWSIAKNKLGDGNRYVEIARLNKIKSPYKLPEGQRIIIPPQ